jgi:hypothetical protein
MNEHVSEKDLLLAFDGELPAERSEAVRAHTRDCAMCDEKWASLGQLSEEVAGMRSTNIRFRPQEAAVSSLVARLNRAGSPRKTHWAGRSLVFANTLVAVAVAITCIVMFPTPRRATPATPHPAAVYDLDETVPAGYVSLPFADPALPLDDAEVLPVELSAEDLELMGVDASDAPEDGVQAEVLIGIDGWPRAIRIVE